VDGTCSINGEEMIAHRLLVGKPEGKRPLERQNIGGWITLRWVWEI
jgi:hypothetical protein